MEIAIANEKIRGNIMSVELAMRRELAYRRKIEMLQKQSQSGPKQDRMTSQTPSQSPSAMGVKRKAASGELQRLPPAHPQSSYGFQPPRKISVNLTCSICQVPCSSAFNLKQHREGQKHKVKLKELEEIQKHGGERARQLPMCNLCGIICMNEGCLQSHLIGKKHAARVQAIEDAKKANEQEAGSAEIKWEEWDWVWSHEAEGKEYTSEEDDLGH